MPDAGGCTINVNGGAELIGEYWDCRPYSGGNEDVMGWTPGGMPRGACAPNRPQIAQHRWYLRNPDPRLISGCFSASQHRCPSCDGGTGPSRRNALRWARSPEAWPPPHSSPAAA
jgi:hypothetical protein